MIILTIECWQESRETSPPHPQLMLSKLVWYFLNCAVFLLVSSQGSLYVVHIRLANTDSPCVGCLLTLLTVSSDTQGFSVLMNSSLSIFFFYCLCFWCPIQEITVKSSLLKIFLYVFFQGFIILALWIQELIQRARNSSDMGSYYLKNVMCRGAWVTQWMKHWTPDFRSGHNLWVERQRPPPVPAVCGACSRFSVCFSLCASPTKNKMYKSIDIGPEDIIWLGNKFLWFRI